MRHLRTLFDISPAEFHAIEDLAHRLKSDWQKGSRQNWLANQTLALLFEKPSLRTRVSFEAGMTQLGGTPLYLTQDVGWQQREATSDFIQVLAEYVDVVVCRAFSHHTVEELASYNCVPIINGLTDMSHPCQAMADIMTMREIAGKVAGKQVTYVGDGNNVARSLLHACGMAGMRFRLVGPTEYHIEASWIARVKDACNSLDVEQTTDVKAALSDADFVYTDVWTSMGQEAEAASREQDFKAFQVNGDLMRQAPDHCRVLHCLPARRGKEITDEVIDSPKSAVIQQAGNRMHLQKGLLVWLAAQNNRLDQKRLEEAGRSGISKG
ncbi:MAG: ornithine carbamoyltransferase [Pirellulaceae bacterium]|nr:ornithine carbamoyltransferase [Pirellulaceae bacterium]